MSTHIIWIPEHRSGWLVVPTRLMSEMPGLRIIWHSANVGSPLVLISQSFLSTSPSRILCFDERDVGESVMFPRLLHQGLNSHIWNCVCHFVCIMIPRFTITMYSISLQSYYNNDPTQDDLSAAKLVFLKSVAIVCPAEEFDQIYLQWLRHRLRDLGIQSLLNVMAKTSTGMVKQMSEQLW